MRRRCDGEDTASGLAAVGQSHPAGSHGPRKISRAAPWLSICLVLLVFPSAPGAFGADPGEMLKGLLREERVEVAIEGVAGEPLENVRSALVLPEGLVREGEVNRAWLERFARQAEDVVRDALKPFGYYDAEVTTSLEALPEGRRRLRVVVERGQPVRVRNVAVSLTGPGKDEDALRDLVEEFPLERGDVLNQKRYEQAKGAIESEAVSLGYLDAAYTVHEIRVSRTDRWAEIALVLDTGPRYRFGATTITGAPDYPEPFLRRYLSYHGGRPFSFAELGKTQANFINSERFEQAIVRPDRAGKEGSEMPVQVQLKPAPPKRFRPGIGYGTDTGARISLQYRDLNAFHRGQELEANVNAAERAQTAALDYRFPSARNLRSFRALRTGYQREVTETYVSRVLSAEAEETRGFARDLLASGYVRLQQEDFDVGPENRRSKLVVVGLWGSQRRQDSVVRPTRGYQVRGEVRGTHQALGSDTGFLQFLLDAGALLPLPQRLSVLGRLDGGATALNDPFAELPASLRFFAGGDRSVRGYAYRSLGPRNDQGEVVGGRNLLVGSVEVERGLFQKWGVAAFYDVGNAFDDPKRIELRQGTGLGLRYYSPVGPLRLDVARQIGVPDPRFRIHFSMGMEL
ncbi:MAG: outer membrane protein assembly factor [Deltaproteobacteria bacterium]|nr:outer membrane protein assembly factor [Deltaproteobacteria bacterium]